MRRRKAGAKGDPCLPLASGHYAFYMLIVMQSSRAATGFDASFIRRIHSAASFLGPSLSLTGEHSERSLQNGSADGAVAAAAGAVCEWAALGGAAELVVVIFLRLASWGSSATTAVNQALFSSNETICLRQAASPMLSRAFPPGDAYLDMITCKFVPLGENYTCKMLRLVPSTNLAGVYSNLCITLNPSNTLFKSS